MADPRLAAIRAAVEGATPGPWEAGAGWVYTAPIYDDDRRLADVLGLKYVDPARRDAEAERAQLNVEFIAMARTAVPELLDLVDRLEAENQQLRANLEEVKGQLANCHKFIAKAVPPGTFVVMSDD